MITQYKIKYVLKVFKVNFMSFGGKRPSFGFELSEIWFHDRLNMKAKDRMKLSVQPGGYWLNSFQVFRKPEQVVLCALFFSSTLSSQQL